MKIGRIALLAVCGSLTLVSCNNGGTSGLPKEDLDAKSMLQGVWMSEFEEDIAFTIEGDTVRFPDEGGMPIYFRVERDSFALYGANTVKYAIVRLSADVFEFVNQSGESVKVLKADDIDVEETQPADTVVVSINQSQLLKSDTVAYYDGEKYHCYVQVNPTTYRVVQSKYNDDGVQVDHVYYDNIVHLSVFHGAEKIFSSNIVKADYSDFIEENILKQVILSDLTFFDVEADGVHLFASLAIPNSSSSFLVETIVSYDGKITKQVKE